MVTVLSDAFDQFSGFGQCISFTSVAQALTAVIVLKAVLLLLRLILIFLIFSQFETVIFSSLFLILVISVARFLVS